MKIERPKSKQPIPENAKKVFKGVLFDVYQWEQNLFNGTKTIFEKAKRPDTVVIFPILPDGRILLLEQEQPGRIPSFDTPGGRIEEGEDVLSAAKREMLEETGYEAEKFILLDAQQPINKVDWAVYTFIAKGLRKVGEINPDAGEKIKLYPVNFDKLLDTVTAENFYSPEPMIKFLEVKYNSEKRKELEELFKPLA